MEQILTLKKEASNYKFITPLWLVKVTHYEYWSMWFFYFPTLFYWLYLAFRSRSLTYFTAANPGIELGGFFGESKINILNKIKKDYLPVTIFIPKGTDYKNIISLINQHNLSFPFICKPNVGERGNNVEKIINEDVFIKYLNNNSFDFIIQEFITYELELGILYFSYPDGSKSGITSIVEKEFLSITGDGISTIEELINENTRARFQLKSMRNKLGEKINAVLPSGQKLMLEPIGNHCRGTKFINANNLINSQLVKVFDKIAKDMDGFYFGRFDLKVKSLDDLYQGTNIIIMEVNGTTSEPAHIYDPRYSLINAYRDIFYNMKLVYNISKQNNKIGVKFTPFNEFYRTVKKHFLHSK